MDYRHGSQRFAVSETHDWLIYLAGEKGLAPEHATAHLRVGLCSCYKHESSTKAADVRMSTDIRNVPILTTLEMNLFLSK